MKATREVAVLVAACAACCAPLIAGAAAIVAPPVLVAGGAAVAVGAGLARVARRRQGASQGDTDAASDPAKEAGSDASA
jgi:hypothetical protein